MVLQIHWMRAARTDKGVSAACQVVSAKLLGEPIDTFCARVNQQLPAEVRLHV
jgi:tRNA pseudouridine38-40 synthase